MFNWALNMSLTRDSKDSKYDVNFKLTQIRISIKTFYWQKEENTLILSNFASECGRIKLLTQVQREKVAKENFSNDIARINAAAKVVANRATQDTFLLCHLF